MVLSLNIRDSSKILRNMNFSFVETKCQGAIIRMRLRNAALATSETRHEIKRIKLMLKSRSISNKRKTILEKSLRHFSRKLNLYEKEERNSLRSLNNLRSDPNVTDSAR